MCLGKQTAFTTVKKWTPFITAHIEPMRGTPYDSKVYCSKTLDPTNAQYNPDAFHVERGECTLIPPPPLQPRHMHLRELIWQFNQVQFMQHQRNRHNLFYQNHVYNDDN